MKRSLICFLLTVLLCVSGAVYAAVALGDRADEVVYTERVLLGDPSMVEGVTVTADISMMGQHEWTTGHTLGREPETAVDYTYYHERQSGDPYRPFEGMYLSNDFDYDIDMENDPSELSGLTLAFRELIDSGPGGSSRTEKIVRVGDYYEFYPIGATIRLPGVEYVGWSSAFSSDPPLEEMDENGMITMEDGSVVQMGPEAMTIYAFQQFFRIPVVEEQYVGINIEWDGDEPASYGYTDISKEGTDWFGLSTVSASTDTACYFTFSPRTYGGELVDTGHIPGGYGIYRLPLHPVGEEYMLGYDGRELENVCPLDPVDEVLGLYTNRDGKDLLMLAIEDETIVLTVIDTAAMQIRQRIELLRGEELYTGGTELHEDFLYLRMTESERAVLLEDGSYPKREDGTYDIPEQTEYVSVLTWDGSGEYTVALKVHSGKQTEDGTLSSPSHAELDWNGEELILCGRLFDYTYAYGADTCGYTVAVYDESGMTYYAEYASSLFAGNKAKACDRGETVIRWP